MVVPFVTLSIQLHTPLCVLASPTTQFTASGFDPKFRYFEHLRPLSIVEPFTVLVRKSLSGAVIILVLSSIFNSFEIRN
jgi:hypothetical protein